MTLNPHGFRRKQSPTQNRSLPAQQRRLVAASANCLLRDLFIFAPACPAASAFSLHRIFLRTAPIRVLIEQAGALRFELHGGHALAQQTAHMVLAHRARGAQHHAHRLAARAPERIQLARRRQRMIVQQRVERVSLSVGQALQCRAKTAVPAQPPRSLLLQRNHAKRPRLSRP